MQNDTLQSQTKPTEVMNKHYLSIIAFATLLCMMLFGAISCKKDDTPDPDEADFFIDVDFLPKTETNGEVAPRLVVNFNDEAAMIEFRRPSAGTPMETVLLLCPDNEAMMLCGNDSLMVCAAYDMETYTPSRDILLVTPMDENSLLLTKGFMDWNTNTMVTGDMMVLPSGENSKNRGIKGDIDGEIRSFFFNRFVKPLAEKFDRVESFCGVFGIQGGIAFTYIKTTITTGLTTILYADDPEGLYDATEFSVTNWTGSVVQSGILNYVPEKYGEVASRILALLDWHSDGGHGKVNDYVGGTGEEHSILGETQYLQAYDMIAISTPAAPDPMFIVNLNVGNVTENSVYLKGSFQFGNNSSATPVEMGYIVKIDGGPEQTHPDMYFNGITVSGLQKATKYTAYAYVKSAFGDRVLSPGVTFWTLGFEAFPTSLTFPAEGDTKYVGLSYSEEDITSWDISSSPSWCIATKDGNKSFSVKVDESTETRSGTITITARSNALGSITQDIAVSQGDANGWDGTVWLFSGSLTTNYPETGSAVEQVAFTLVVNDVSNNNIEFSFAQALSVAANGYSGNYTVNGNGNLVYTATASGPDTHANCQVTFARTGAATATANFSYREVANGNSSWYITSSGILQGTLINAKEMLDCEGMFHYRDGVLWPCSVR